MSDTTANVWGATPDPDVERDSSTRIPELLAFMAFGFYVVTVPVLGLPLNEVMPLLVLGISVFRRPTVPIPAWFVIGLVGVLLLLVFSAFINDLLPVRRLLHVVLYIGLAINLANGRIHNVSAARGLAWGLGIGVSLSILGIGNNSYPGRLTGMFSDPNQAGMVITILGPLAMVLGVTTKIRRNALLAVILVAVYRTLSRTALLAAAFGAIWLWQARRFGRVVGLITVALMIRVVAYFSDDARSFGQFQDRVGSDKLRERIYQLEQIKVADSGWLGHGPGTAKVTLDKNEFFFHSSYLGLRNEGGWLTLLLLLGVLVLAMWALTGLGKEDRSPFHEVALISAAICAVNLGEVLLELPLAIALGMGMHHVATVRARSAEAETDTTTPLLRPRAARPRRSDPHV